MMLKSEYVAIFLASSARILFRASGDDSVSITSSVPTLVQDGVQFNISCTVNNAVPMMVAVVNAGGTAVAYCMFREGSLILASSQGVFQGPVFDVQRSVLSCRSAYGLKTSAVYSFFLTASYIFGQDGFYKCAMIYYPNSVQTTVFDASPPKYLTVFVPPEINLYLPKMIDGSPANGVCSGIGKPTPTLQVSVKCLYCKLVIVSVTNYSTAFSNQFNVYGQNVTFALEYPYTWDGALVSCRVTNLPGYSGGANALASVSAPTFNSTIPPTVNINDKFTVVCAAKNAVLTRVALVNSGGQAVVWCNCSIIQFNTSGDFSGLASGESLVACVTTCFGGSNLAVFTLVTTTNYQISGYYSCAYTYRNGSINSTQVDKPSLLTVSPPSTTSAIPGNVTVNSVFQITCTAKNAVLKRIAVVNSKKVEVMWCNCDPQQLNGTGGFVSPTYLNLVASAASCGSTCQLGANSVTFYVNASSNYFLTGSYACAHTYQNGSSSSTSIDSFSPLTVSDPTTFSTPPTNVVNGNIFVFTCNAQNAIITRVAILNAASQAVMWCYCDTWQLNGTGSFQPSGSSNITLSLFSCVQMCIRFSNYVRFYVLATINPLQDGYYRCSYTYRNATSVSTIIDPAFPLLVTTQPYGLQISPSTAALYIVGDMASITCWDYAKPPEALTLLPSNRALPYNVSTITGGSSADPDFRPLGKTLVRLTFQATMQWSAELVRCKSNRSTSTATVMILIQNQLGSVTAGAVVQNIASGSTSSVANDGRYAISVCVILSVLQAL